jgi:hypothetical protein
MAGINGRRNLTAPCRYDSMKDTYGSRVTTRELEISFDVSRAFTGALDL